MDKSFSSRGAQPEESAEELAFWRRCWEAVRQEGVPSGKEVWHERAVWRFMRFIEPRRLREATARDVTDWLRLVAAQPASEAGGKTGGRIHAYAAKEIMAPFLRRTWGVRYSRAPAATDWWIVPASSRPVIMATLSSGRGRVQLSQPLSKRVTGASAPCEL